MEQCPGERKLGMLPSAAKKRHRWIEEATHEQLLDVVGYWCLPHGFIALCAKSCPRLRHNARRSVTRRSHAWHGRAEARSGRGLHRTSGSVNALRRMAKSSLFRGPRREAL